MSDILNGFLQKAYNLPENEVAETLFKKSDDGSITTELREDALDVLLRLDAERVAKLAKPVDTTEVYNKAVKKTEAEVHGTWEKRLREAYPAVDPEKKLKGEDLLNAVKAAQQQSSSYDPNQVKKTDEYLSLERQMREALEAKEQEYAAKVQEVQMQFQRQQVWGDMSQVIREKFMGLNPILPEDKAKAQRLVDDFVLKFKDYEWQRTDDGRTLPLQNGQRINNQHGHAMFLEDLVAGTANLYFDFKKQEATGQAGNENGRQAITITFKDDEDFMKRYNAESDPKKKEELAAAYEAQQQG